MREYEKPQALEEAPVVVICAPEIGKRYSTYYLHLTHLLAQAQITMFYSQKNFYLFKNKNTIYHINVSGIECDLPHQFGGQRHSTVTAGILARHVRPTQLVLFSTQNTNRRNFTAETQNNRQYYQTTCGVMVHLIKAV